MFSIKYQKGRDNAVADAVGHVASNLETEVVKSILNGVVVGTIGRADAHDPAVVRPMKGYKSKLTKLQSRQGPPTHV